MACCLSRTFSKGNSVLLWTGDKGGCGSRPYWGFLCHVTPFEDAIGVGRSGTGADTAIVLRATYPAYFFDKDLTKRLEIKEIIANAYF